MTHLFFKVTIGITEKTTKLRLPPCLRMDEVNRNYYRDTFLVDDDDDGGACVEGESDDNFWSKWIGIFYGRSNREVGSTSWA